MLHCKISDLKGSLFLGGLHLTILVIKISSLDKLMWFKSSSRTLPALPINGLPARSSFAPGASPIKSMSAFGLPWPGTVLVLYLCREQLVQFEI